MSSLYRIIGYLILFLLIVATAVFFFWLFVIGSVIAGIYGIYRYYRIKFKQRHSPPEYFNRPNNQPKNSYPGEVIDMPIEYTDKKK